MHGNLWVIFGNLQKALEHLRTLSEFFSQIQNLQRSSAGNVYFQGLRCWIVAELSMVLQILEHTENSWCYTPCDIINNYLPYRNVSKKIKPWFFFVLAVTFSVSKNLRKFIIISSGLHSRKGRQDQGLTLFKQSFAQNNIHNVEQVVNKSPKILN